MAINFRKGPWIIVGLVTLATLGLASAWQAGPAPAPRGNPPIAPDVAVSTPGEGDPSAVAEAPPGGAEKAVGDQGALTIDELLALAEDVHRSMQHSLQDYTARFVKQELNDDGVLGEEQELTVKIQTRFRQPDGKAPKRVYLKFVRPEANRGREVIWAADLHDGKMAVHENYFPVNLKTIWLDPNGYLAMQGQRYPISEIGMVRLVEKLIERGELDRGNPNIRVTIDRNHRFNDLDTHLIKVKRLKPSGREDDFSLAEIIIDPERNLLLGYRSFGWPQPGQSSAPLLESYHYYDVETNVELTQADFDPENAEYGFP